MSILRHLRRRDEMPEEEEEETPQRATQLSLGPVARMGNTRFFTTVSLDDDDECLLSVGDHFALREDDSAFGVAKCLFETREGLQVEFGELKRPVNPRPYVGSRGLYWHMDTHKTDLVAHVVDRKVTVESLETFRLRAQFPEDVYYIADKYSGGHIVPTDTICPRGRWEKKFQSSAASSVSQADLDRLLVEDKNKIELEDDHVPKSADKKDSVRSYKLKRRAGSKRPIPVVSARPSLVSDVDDVVIELEDDADLGEDKARPNDNDEDDDLFQLDSEDERERALVRKGLVAEPISSDYGSEGGEEFPPPESARKRLKRVTLTTDASSKSRKGSKEDAAAQSVVIKPKVKKEEPRKMRLKARTATATTPEKKALKKGFDVKQLPSFAFLNSDDEEADNPWIEVSGDSDSDHEFVVEVEPNGDDHAAMPAAFRQSTPTEDTENWLEYNYFVENDPKFREACEKQSDNVYFPSIRRVEKKLRSAAEALGSGGHWNPVVRHMLTHWSRFQNMSGRMAGLEDHCQLCNKADVHPIAVKLSGQYYDSEAFLDKGIYKPSSTDPNGDRQVMVTMGETCLRKASLFHRLRHFKLGCLHRMEERAAAFSREDRRLAHQPKELMKRVLDKPFVDQIRSEITDLVETALQFDINRRAKR